MAPRLRPPLEEVARYLEHVVLRARLLGLGREEVAQVARLLPALARVGAALVRVRVRVRVRVGFGFGFGLGP